MELLRRTTVALAAVATLGVGTAKADLVLVGEVTIGGTGLGTVNTVLTLTSQGNNTTEQGCVGRGAGVDFIGSTASGACVAGATTDVQTGASQTQTRTLAEAGITTGANFAIMFNAVEPGGNSITMNTLSVTFYNATTGAVLFTANYTAAPHDFLVTNTGTGNTGQEFTLNAAEAAQLQGFINTNTTAGIRVGISTSEGNPLAATGGPETLFIFNSGAATVVPEPSTSVLMATGLIGLVGFVRRRRA
jgi:PEP-CTERM motif